ncbi:DNA polymerase III subunit delta [Candidatus Ichthyocystis hellenicum]|uniref:DNA polymerase III subunit delta n=1 Tax=Candidatus Ichthyocystis hellenicum TaxID=1561003 RepID=UPI000B88ED23|nr:DNA polymerase III subunit delta [Candidatus Ichthyocystis hellenicum]
MLIESAKFIHFFQRRVFPGCSVVYGDDEFFRAQVMDEIRRGFRAQDEFGERLVFDCRKNTRYDELKAVLRNASLFSSSRLFEILCVPSQVESLLQFFSGDKCGNFSVLILDDLSWQDRKNRWFVAGCKSEEVCFFSCVSPSPDHFIAWINDLLLLNGMTFSPDVTEFLATFFEGNACGVYQALEQLALQQTEEKTITVDYIQESIFSTTRYGVDDCVQAIFSRDRKRFVRILNYLCGSDESLISLLVWRLAQDLRVCCAYHSESPLTPKQEDSFFQRRKIFGVRRSFFLKAVKSLVERDIVQALACLNFIDRKHKGIVPGYPWDDLLWTGLFLMRDR